MVNVRGYALIVVLSVIRGMAFVAIKRADAELNLTTSRALGMSRRR